MHEVHLLIDEAAALGPMPVIDDALDKYRAMGVRLQLFYQSPAQLKHCFPNGQDQTVLANSTQVYFAINDASADAISQRLGESTIVVQSGGTGSGTSQTTSAIGQDNSGRSANTNRNWSLVGRRLLKPEEILTLPQRIAITFAPGTRPIATFLERHYERKKERSFLNAVWTLFQSTVVFLVGMGSLLATHFILEEIYHEQVFRRHPGGNEATRYSGEHGGSQRPLQRAGVRPLRSRPVYQERQRAR